MFSLPTLPTLLPTASCQCSVLDRVLDTVKVDASLLGLAADKENANPLVGEGPQGLLLAAPERCGTQWAPEQPPVAEQQAAEAACEEEERLRRERELQLEIQAKAARALEERQRLEKERQESERREAERRELERQERERLEQEHARLAEQERLRAEVEAQERQRLEKLAADRKRVDGFLKANGFASVNARRRRLLRSTYPLHVAAKQADADLVTALLALGADPALRSSAGQTAGQVAKACDNRGSHAAVRRLLGGA